MLGVGDGDADTDLLDAVNQYDVAGFGLIDGGAFKALEDLDLIDFCIHRRRVRAVEHADLLA